MIFPDVNLLLYAYDETSEFHAPAAKWLRETLTKEQVFFSWHTITGFLRIITNPRSMANPLKIATAVGVVSHWLELENTHLVEFEKKTWPLLRSMLIDAQATGNLVMDAHLAAMAGSCGATLATTDRDFSRFPDVRLTNPLRP